MWIKCAILAKLIKVGINQKSSFVWWQWLTVYETRKCFFQEIGAVWQKHLAQRPCALLGCLHMLLFKCLISLSFCCCVFSTYCLAISQSLVCSDTGSPWEGPRLPASLAAEKKLSCSYHSGYFGICIFLHLPATGCHQQLLSWFTKHQMLWPNPSPVLCMRADGAEGAQHAEQVWACLCFLHTNTSLSNLFLLSLFRVVAAFISLDTDRQLSRRALLSF